MRISANDVDEEQPCEECASEPARGHQKTKMKIYLKEFPTKEQAISSVECIRKKFQDLNIHVDPDERNGACSKKPSEVGMEGAEGGSSPPSESNALSSCHSAIPFWNKFKEDLKEEIIEDVMEKVRKEFSGKLDKDNVADATFPGFEDVLHYGVYCDSCDQQIRGVRYKCGNCEDFDLCERCESGDLHNKHDASHIFLKIRIPSCLFTMHDGTRKKIYQVPLRNTDSAHNTAPNNKASDAAMMKVEEKKDCMKAKFILDETIPDRTSIAPGVEFVKTWRVCNSGNAPWTKDTFFRMFWGNQDFKPLCNEVPAPQLNSGEEGLVSVTFTAPATLGHYESYWEFQHQGKPFGDTFWCRIRVESAQPIEIFPVVVPNRSSALKALKIQHHQCLLKNKRKVKEEKRRKKENRKKDVDQIFDIIAAVREKQSSQTRNIGQRKSLVTSPTTTPNNTPFDLTPPKSPEPDEFVEIKNEVSISAGEMVGDHPLEGNLNISVSATSGDDKASIATLSSSDSESEFVVIPMPKCFSILDANEYSHIPKNRSDSSLPTKETAADSTEKAVLQKEINPKSLSHDVEVPEATENVNLVTTIHLKEDCDKKVVVSNVSLSCSPSSSSISIVDNNEDNSSAGGVLNKATDHAAEPHKAFGSHRSSLASLNDAENSGHGSSSTFPKFPLNEESDSTHAAEPTTSQTREDLTDPASGMGVEVLPGNVVKNAIHAAASVYKTARDVLLNLQLGRNEEEEVNSLQQLTPLQQLAEMGFYNRALNEELLLANGNDVARVVAELVGLNDNEWYASRHAATAEQPPSSG